MSLFPARPAKQSLPRESRTAHQVHPINFSEIPTSLSTCRRSNDFCAPRRNTARPIYFYAVIYIIRTSTAICSDDIYMYIYIMRWYLHNRNVTERQFWRSPSVARTRTISNVFVFWFFVFCFFFTVVCEEGLKWYTPHATLIPAGHPTNYILAPPACRKSWALIIWRKFWIHLTGK